MNETLERIFDLFDSLPEAERRAVAVELMASVKEKSFHATLNSEQHAELAQSIAQADRGEGTLADAVMAEIAAKHGFARQ